MMHRRIAFYSLVFLYMIIGSCTTDPEKSDEMNLTIRLLGKPQCNGTKSAAITDQLSASKSCVEYAFDQDNGILILRHLNAAFNCCPDSLWCTVVLKNDTIIIQEFEKNKGCKCDCLYDLDLEVEGMEPGKYQLKLIEPYVLNQNEICFKMDLLNLKQGFHCVDRTQYPY